ncbi:tetratricopeptide repeat protein [Luteimonas suaedae]|uniref:tetratricopeptide repeat protein n=1 Tax=Luteimonas suaedae TaxID=2605430 RepID=UPI001659864D|nr:tetratricopeptide repeat protein [Luteimonas suaedae]
MLNWILAALLLPSVAAPDIGLPDRTQVMRVPPELRAQLHEYVTSQSRSEEQRLRLLAEFVFADEGLALEYENGNTRTVEQAWRSGKVNCLSFSLLFTALAREAGLNAYVQEIDKVLAWYQEEGIVYNSSHVNVGVHTGNQRHTVDVSGGAIMARDRPVAVSEDRALAHFYGNRGAELMAAGALEPARIHMEAAIALDPDYATNWSNFGVLHLRSGDVVAAERAYTRALALDPMHAAALFNIVGLHRRMGDAKRAAEFQARLERAQLADPFHQFLLASDYESRGDYARAVQHYRRAIRLHGKEHRFHFGLARTYLLMGETRRASRALLRARALGDDEDRARYQAKLDRLSRTSR